AESLRSLVVPLDELIAEGRLRELPGIGEAIAAAIPVLRATGTHEMLEALRSDIPAGVLEMLAVPGLKPEKVLALFRELGIRSLAELGQAAKAGKLAGAKRFGPAFQHKVLQGMAALEAAHGRMHIHRAAARLEEVRQQLAHAMPHLKEVAAAGELRRGCELVGDLVLVAAAPGRAEMLTFGEASVLVADPARYGITMLLATGARRHIEQLQELAAEKGFVLAPEGLRTGAAVIARTEREIYTALGL